VARVTIEDCLEQVPNRFALIHLAFQRVKQLRAGSIPIVQTKNKEVVVALREIAAGMGNYPLENVLPDKKKEIGIESDKTGKRELPR
jgi:DNA-directed RNA polymerase subunit omega